ncbi:MAG TPA: amidohydrolase family protein, partial [Roseococcus sp.]|nr:amidohydrolase family protein [Roseococcus sp.]
MQADFVLQNGPIFRGLHGRVTRGLAVAGGRVVALGDVSHCIGPDTRRLDLAGRLAIPAFNEAHMHLLPFGLGLAQVSLRASQVRTLDALLDRMRAAAASAPRGEWVLGEGYDHAALNIGRHPSAAELD